MRFRHILLILFLLIKTAVAFCSQREIDSSLNLLQNAKEDTSKVLLFTVISKAYNNQNNDSALTYAFQALALAEKLQYHKGLIYSYTTLGNIYWSSSNYPMSLEYHTKTLQTAEAAGDKKSIAVAYGNIGLVYDYLGEYQKAIDYYMKTLPIMEDFKSKKGIANTHINIGAIYGNTGEYPKAIEHFLKGIKAYEEINDKTGIAYCYNNIGAINNQQRNYDEALKNYSQGLKIYETILDKSGAADIYAGISYIYIQQEKYDSAFNAIQKSLKFREELHDHRGIAEAYTYVGGLYMKIIEKHYDGPVPLSLSKELPKNLAFSKQALLDSAYHYYTKANDILLKIGAKMDIFHSISGIGSVLLYQGQSQYALEYFDKALRVAQELNAKKEIMEAYKNISDAYRAMGNYKEALAQHDLYKQWADSVFDSEQSKQIAEMQTRFETEKKEKEIEIKTLRISEQEYQLTRSRIILIVIISATLLLIIIGWLLFTRYKIKQSEQMNATLLRQQELRTQAIIETQENERKRIAQDLHDGIGQTLSGIKINFEKLTQQMNSITTEMQKVFHQSADALDVAYKEVRDLSHQMMPKTLEEADLSDAISELLGRTFPDSSITYTFEKYPLGDINEHTKIGLYRVCQELLNNIMKHANASKISVQLFKAKDCIILIMEDNGTGIKQSNGYPTKGIGLSNIEARVHAMNGMFSIHPCTDMGTVASVRIPVQQMTNHS